MATFNDFQIPDSLIRAVQKLNFVTPSPVQEKAIPVAMTGKDIIACAQTGSGKTAAYCIPVIAKLLESKDSVALVLAPTRELAKQISEVVRDLTVFAPSIGCCVLIGGADMRRQTQTLRRNPRMIIATPGRLTDHLRRGSVSLKTVKFMVLDEADRMLDMGFQPQLDAILKFVPKERQTLLFSATFAGKVRNLAASYLKTPVHITIGEESKPVETVKQSVILTSHSQKNDVLLNELNARKGAVIIFTRTQNRTDRLTNFLEDYGYSVSRIHGGRSQGQRNSAIQGFRSGQYRILVATDIAARGIDVPQIGHVINYDLPMMDDDYVHRIGRTARAGAEGEALSLVVSEDRGQWMRLARRYGIASAAFMAGPANGKTGRPQDTRRHNSRKPEGRPEGRRPNGGFRGRKKSQNRPRPGSSW